MELKASQEMNKYFEDIVSRVKIAYDIATEARKKNLDPSNEVEISLARNMAERVLGLISTVAPQIKDSKMVDRIHELEKEYGILDWRVAFKIAGEIAKQEICKFKEEKEAIEVGIRTGFAYITIGTVSSCLEGFTHLELKNRRDGTGKYFCLHFAGPVRNAGGTAAAVCVLIADYLRKIMGYAEYDPDEKEILRTFCEVEHYNDRCVRVQYMPSKEELDFMTSKMPVEISGDPSEKVEVPNYKNLPRVPTNLIRSGFGLLYSSCLPLKAPKLWKQLSKWGNDFDMEQWNWMEEFLKIQKKAKSKGKKEESKEEKPKIVPVYTYIADLVGGRPVLSHPLATGGFRLRYGRSRYSGLSAQSVHPATMHLVNDFLAIGTQLKLERPGKAAVYTPCDTIEAPIVKLNNGNVVKVQTEEEAKILKKDVKEIIFLGDVLICHGDFFNNGHVLVPSGYCEEWWIQELEKSIVDTFGNLDLEKAADLCKFDLNYLENIINDPMRKFPSARESEKLSNILKTPFHPKWLYHWKDISLENFDYLIQYLANSKIEKSDTGEVKKIILLKEERSKQILEHLGIPHIVATDYLVIEKNWAHSFYVQLNSFNFNFSGDGPLERINSPKKIIFRDKSGTYIGARMGRPEKAKMRKMKGSPHGLFPVGEEGGRMRSFQAALQKEYVTGDYPILKCSTCDKSSVYPLCMDCGTKCDQFFECSTCGPIKEMCDHDFVKKSINRKISFRDHFNDGLNRLKTTIYPDLIKGIKGTVNKEHFVENISKSILRAKHNIHVNKDGTVRYDATEIPVTHFKPSEIDVSITKLKELGYHKDIKGKELVHNNQILEIKCQDIILPCCPEVETPSDVVLTNTCNYIDELLEKVYGLSRFYNIKKREDLVGHVIIALAPHTSAGTAGRILGFSNTQGCIAHPLMHCACRRDCVSYDTKFVSMKGNKIYYENIGDRVENLIKKNKLNFDSKNTLKIFPKEESFVFGIDPNSKKFKKKRIKYFIKNPSPNYWVKIGTGTGREFTMTDNHKFIYYEGNSFKTKRAKDIQILDRLPILKNFNIETKEQKLNLVELLYDKLPNAELKNVNVVGNPDFFKFVVKKSRSEILKLMKLQNKKNLSRWYKQVPLKDFKKLIDEKIISYEELPQLFLKTNHNSVKFNISLDVDHNLASLIGYYLAEGYSRRTSTVSQVSFRIDNTQIQKEIIRLTKKVFDISPSLGENKTKITIGHKFIYYLFQYCFGVGSGAYNKRVPYFIYNSSDDVVISLLSAYFDGDGSVVPKRNTITFYSVSRSLLDDVALLISRFGIIGRYSETAPRLPGKTVLENYAKLGKDPKTHILVHLTYFGRDVYKLSRLLKSNISYKVRNLKLIKKNVSDKRITVFNKKTHKIIEKGDSIIDYVKSVEIIENADPSYCLEIEWENEADKNILWGEQIINARCDGDEIGFFLLMDGFLNFSKKFLPQSRGGTMDAPLVLTSIIDPTGVDDMIFDMDIVWKYPLEFYEGALNYAPPWELKIDQVVNHLSTPLQYEGYGFTHDNGDLNAGVWVSSYKTLPTMKDKLLSQMDIAEKLRAVDTSDVAALVINKHFLKDTKGNLRKFSQQQFRCVNCNTKYRRPPLSGKCDACNKGKIIFTISEGSVIKYLEPSLEIAGRHNVPPYVKQTLDITKLRIDSYFGKDKEKQEGLNKWFGET